ncbi:ATP-binding protein [Winogradskyella ouciana]|uniref:histidine kinase n=1 Tax=Winogradskyella ouciana TaxID=2608631 RepID=A0A7K1GA73_9FLAO|nr:ATP-binding protein [Winogradskyella ouciana]MTE25925.1 response regulator [Winogradskyella ouciana]
MKKRFSFFLFIFVLNFFNAQEVYYLDTKYPVHDLQSQLKVYTDSLNSFSPNDILRADNLSYLKGSELPRYLSVGTTYWGKLEIKAPEKLDDWTLHFEDKHIGPPAWTKSNGKVDVYGFVDGEQIFHKKTGVEYAKSERDVDVHWALNQVSLSDLPTNTPITLIIKAQGNQIGYPAYFNLSARSPSQPYYHKLFSFQRSFNLFFFGVTFMIFLYHLLQFFYLKEKVYLWFSVWLLFCTLTQAMTVGFILGSIPDFRFSVFVLIAGGIFYTWWYFGRSFINSKIKFPVLDKVMWVMASLVLIEIILASIYGAISPSSVFMTNIGYHYIFLMIYSLVSFIVSIILLTKNDQFAKYFGFGSLIGSTFLIIGLFWSMGYITPIKYFDPYATGIFLQIIIYSFGIAYRRQVLSKANEAERLDAQKTYAEMQRVKDLDEVKTKFFANISHEFRTPLSLISGPLQFAKQSKTTENGDVVLPKKTVDIISNNTGRLQNLIDQLLELSKLESGNIHLSLKQGGLIQFIKSIVFSFESMAERSNISLITSFPEEINIAFYDRDKLQKVLSNLISNAFKFTPKGGMVNFSLNYDDTHFTIEVSDTGIGMSAEEMKHVFERFYRSERTETKGSGIGLALTKEIIDIHNGQININSRKDKGTTFKVRLPYTMENLPKDISMVVDSKAVDYSETTIDDFLDDSKIVDQVVASQPMDKLILIVEDNADLRDFITNILGESYQLLVAEDGLQGERMAIEHIPDLILSDVMMPKKDGYEMCHSLKLNTKTSHIPVILLTAKAGHTNKMEGLNQGADIYLTKPFHADELLINIKNLIANRERQWNYFKASDLTSVDNLELSNLDNQFLQKSAAFIKQNLDNEKLSVEDLAGAVGFSRSQYHRKLKALVNKSANQLIVEIRLNEAHKMLTQKEGSVSEIAYSVGYSNLSYFTKSFKDKFGQLPSKI